MSKKIKVTLPQNIYEIIKNDIDDFNMTSNYFMNYIFLNLNEKYKNQAKVREIKSKINEPIDNNKALTEIAITSVGSGKPNLKSYKNKFKKSNNK